MDNGSNAWVPRCHTQRNLDDIPGSWLWSEQAWLLWTSGEWTSEWRISVPLSLSLWPSNKLTEKTNIKQKTKKLDLNCNNPNVHQWMENDDTVYTTLLSNKNNRSITVKLSYLWSLDLPNKNISEKKNHIYRASIQPVVRPALHTRVPGFNAQLMTPASL